jgi:pentatricopeptide repeat protein
MILHGYVKQCKCEAMSKMWFLLEEGGFHNSLTIG